MWRSTPRRLLSVACIATLLCAIGPAASAPLPSSSSRPIIFLLDPDPPKAGLDLEVVWIGSNPERIYFKIGDGDWKQADCDRWNRFKISWRLLKPGKNLYLVQRGIGGKGNLCVTIEP